MAVFKHLTSLQVLELNGNRVGADGATELAESIKQLTSLLVLGLSANTIGAEELQCWLEVSST